MYSPVSRDLRKTGKLPSVGCGPNGTKKPQVYCISGGKKKNVRIVRFVGRHSVGKKNCSLRKRDRLETWPGLRKDAALQKPTKLRTDSSTTPQMGTSKFTTFAGFQAQSRHCALHRPLETQQRTHV